MFTFISFRFARRAALALLLAPSLAGAQVAPSNTVFPTLRGLVPDSALPGEDAAVTGSGGYAVLPDGSNDRTLRSFVLYFDRTTVGTLNCAADRCAADFLIPADATPGEHQVSTEGGSSLALNVVAPPPPPPPPPLPPVVTSDSFSDLAPKEPRNDKPAGPGGLSAKPGNVNETDVVRIAGAVDSLPYVFVSAAGSGKQYKLTRWRVDNQDFAAESDSVAVDGFDVKLHHPGILGGIFISAARDVQGNLWLTSWRSQNGQLIKLHSRGYGENAQVKVGGYDMTGRFLSPNLAEIVTAIVDQDQAPRLVTWHVDSSGNIVGKQATNPVVAGLRLSTGRAPVVSHQRDNLYVVNFAEGGNNVSWQYWSVAGNGAAALLGETNRRNNLRGTSTSLGSATSALDALPLTRAGQTLAFVNTAADAATPLALVTYENNEVGGIFASPYRIAAGSDDLNPDAPGVLLNPPTISASSYMVTDGLYESALGQGQGNLFSNLGFGPPTPATGMASVTKAMTLDRVLEAVALGKVELSDPVTLTAAMFGGNSQSYGFEDARMTKPVNGVAIPLQVGDVVTLRTLLLASIMLSDRVATLAAAFHAADGLYNDDDSLSFAELVGGTTSQGLFVDSMNARAIELGMSNTRYCGTYGEAHSIPQDQVSLWMSASLNDDFRDITSKLAFTAADSAAESAATGSSFNITLFNKISDSAELYPGLLGAKGGSAGVMYGIAYVNNQLVCNQPETNVRSCNRCLATHHERLERPMFTAQMQAVGRGNNAMALLDYGYGLTFTPDHLSDSGAQGGKVGDFGLDSLDPILNVTAAVVGGNVQACLWNVTESAIDKSECRNRSYSGLLPGPKDTGEQFSGNKAPPPAKTPMAEPAVVDMEDVTSIGADAEYLVATRRLGMLSLDLWRVGPRPTGIIPQ